MGRLRDDIIAMCSKWRRRSGVVALVSEIKESTSSTTDSESHSRTVSLLEKLKAFRLNLKTRSGSQSSTQRRKILWGPAKIFENNWL